jgi:hypothetical protein
MPKVHWLGSAHELIDSEMVCGTADRRSLFGRKIAIHYGAREFLLAPVGFLSQRFFLGTTASVDLELLASAYYLV